MAKFVFGWWFGLAHKVKKQFCIYLGSWSIVFQSDFCDETVRSCRSFWVPWKLHSERGKNDKIWPFTSKMVQKRPFCGKIWANGAKRVFIWVSVSPKEVESDKISHTPANFFHFVIQWCNGWIDVSINSFTQNDVTFW